MLTPLYHRLVCPLMLVLASLGSAPLWLHHAVCHHAECCSTQAAEAEKCPRTECSQKSQSQCSRICDADEARDADTLAVYSRPSPDAAQPASPGSQIHADSHDCLVCFQLSQPQTVALQGVHCSAEWLRMACPSSPEQAVLAFCAGSPPARGPPTVL
jgi:hypothetical protein